jgi:hypothetical protein
MLTVLFLAQPKNGFAQSRDYLTDDEIELVRDAQQIDLRMLVLTHAIDRRLEALKLGTAAPLPKKEIEKWGAMPTGTRIQLLIDIKRILQKAVDDIDNLAERPNSMVVDINEKKPATYSELFPKAVRILSEASARYKSTFAAELSKTNDASEVGAMMDIIELSDEIASAAKKLPADVPSKSAKKH